MENKIRIRKKKPTASFSGSLLQQNFGESISKGYLLWDLDDCTHERRIIPNDYGFAKIDIAKGEDFEERIDDINFSNDKRKTKVYITWEDYEENYSIEKENQIKRLVKDKYGCESVRVEFKELRRDSLELEEYDEAKQYTFEEVFRDWVSEGEYNVDEDLMQELLEFSRDVDLALELDESALDFINDWELNSMEVSNIFSFDKKPLFIDFDKIPGMSGIFGKNFNGKSNVVRAIVWGLYKEMLNGTQSSSKYLVNIYTDSNVGYVVLNLTINGEKYRITRKITTKEEKNTYNTSYEKLVKKYDEEGNYVEDSWEKKLSDKKTGEQIEVQNLVEESIGSFDDFTKTSLQAQGGDGDYISQQQQPKNTLISRFLGLENFKLRHEYSKTFFNDVKRKIKDLGNAIDIELKTKEIDSEIEIKQQDLEKFKLEKEKSEQKNTQISEEIIELTKLIQTVENSGITNKESAENEIKNIDLSILNINNDIESLQNWLNSNFKKELPFENLENIDSLKSSLNIESQNLINLENNVSIIDNFLKQNVEKVMDVDISTFPQEIKELNNKLSELQAKLPTYQGKCCPTCGHVQMKAEPEKEEECLGDIQITKDLIQFKEGLIKKSDEIILHNKKISDAKEKLKNFEDSISIKKDSINLINQKINLLESSKDIISHNKEVDNKSNQLKNKREELEIKTKRKDFLKECIVKFEANIVKIKKNKEIEENIEDKKEVQKTHKLSIYNLDNNINNIFGQIKVLENNKENFGEKLKEINDSERLFKKYSIYQQAVHRDGIPAAIIRKKLPIINSKINSILSEVVDFKIELSILSNGDIVETFFFSEDKSDALPLSSASGSQKFIASIVITEALRYMSRLTKPSLRIIDEGFGTLDDELTFGVVNILNYLRNKYKNVLIITHRNEIKDFADNIIEVVKVTDGISKEVLDNNPKAGVSKVTIT